MDYSLTRDSTRFLVKMFEHLPNEAADTIFRLLGYKLRNKKYIKQIPKDLPIFNLLNQMNDIIYYQNYEYLDQYDEDEDILNNHIADNLITSYFGSEFSYCISFDLSYTVYHKKDTVKTMEIYYSQNNRNHYKVVIKYYFVDYDDSRHEFIPYIPW